MPKPIKPRKPRTPKSERTREYYFPRLNKAQHARAYEVLNNIEPYFKRTCNIMKLSAATRNRISADFMSDLALKIYRIAHTYDPKRKNWDSFLQTALDNIVIDIFRKSQKIAKVELSEGAIKTDPTGEFLEKFLGIEAPYVEDSLIRAERTQALREAIKNLPQIYKTVIKLLVFDKKTDKEISELLGIPRPTVRTRFRDAKKLLKFYLEKDPRVAP